MVTVTAKPGASSRTRNRVREHPGAFTLKNTSNPTCFGGREAHSLHHPDGWFGWLPADEVVLTETPDATTT
jgi:hypothetical protein